MWGWPIAGLLACDLYLDLECTCFWHQSDQVYLFLAKKRLYPPPTSLVENLPNEINLPNFHKFDNEGLGEYPPKHVWLKLGQTGQFQISIDLNTRPQYRYPLPVPDTWVCRYVFNAGTLHVGMFCTPTNNTPGAGTAMINPWKNRWGHRVCWMSLGRDIRDNTRTL